MKADYIIIGGGTAGCVLANRLSADKKTAVLLLEAGGMDNHPELHVPRAWQTLRNTPFDWAFKTEPQPSLNGRSQTLHLGKVLGGSSSINAMLYLRGHQRDYDRWQQAGGQGWSFIELLPYFRRAENQQRGKSPYHGVGGPLDVSDLRHVNPLSHAFVAAGNELGHPLNRDFNGAQQAGFGLVQVMQQDGSRLSSAAAYLFDADQRPNLTLRTNATVTRILFREKEAVGVVYLANGRIHQATARKEIILCAGAINSPKLLMLSGVGPTEQLRRFNIDPIIDSPGVGQNYQDHPIIYVASEIEQPISSREWETEQNILQFQEERRGPLTSPVIEAAGFVQTPSSIDLPNIMFYFVPLLAGKEERHGFTIGAVLLRPESRGQLALASPDPFAPPSIQPNLLAEQSDVQSLLEGMDVGQRLLETKALGQFDGTQVAPKEPFESQDEQVHYLRQHAGTLHNPVGTCRMGDDETAVVNDNLQVYDLYGLRVADASIMPTIIGGDTIAPTIMIAEKAADLILNS